MKKVTWLIIIIVFIIMPDSCKKDSAGIVMPETELPPIPPQPTIPYAIAGNTILKSGLPIQLKGVNALNTFGIGDHNLMDQWNIEIVREFIGNLREQPVDGAPIQAADKSWLHSLQSVVDSNRAHNKVTILCPFGWVDENAKQTLFTGLNPSEQTFYGQYKSKMRLIADHFKDQRDVWIEVWNEPYHWNNGSGYSNDLWLKDQKDMVDNLRRIDGFQSIIVVPGNEQGQSENSIVSKGKDLLVNRYNIVFDLHAYEKWLINNSEIDLLQRVEKVNDLGIAFLIGEVGVINSSGLMQPETLLSVLNAKGISAIAWLWNRNSNDQNALLTNDGHPNDINNNNWGTTYRTFLSQ
jgi:mannan endo-1,4-beta-mannosidase